jgi:hypothetical protein
MICKEMLRRVALVLAALFLLAGCADGVLFQKQVADGGVQRLRIDGGEIWGDLDITPRSRSQTSKDNDDYCIMLKKESTF